jgi:hypothetical protein
MESNKQIVANRKNALKSTGPKTREGKEVVRHNAIKAGLFAKELILDAGLIKESKREFNELLHGLLDDLQPAGATESILVEKIAISLWRLRRAYRAEYGIAADEIADLEKSYDYPHEPETLNFSIRVDIDSDRLSREAKRAEKLSNMEPEDLYSSTEFLDFMKSYYPRQEIGSLSEDKLKGIRRKFRKRLNEYMREMRNVFEFRKKVIPMQLSKLVTNEAVVRFETKLERSILRDLAAIKKLQAMRNGR